MKRHLPYLLLALAVLSAPSAFASNLTVKNLNDSGANSLRWAIATASSGDTITFSVTGVITLTSGQLEIGKNLTIQGPGAGLLTISGNHASRVFLIDGGATVTLDRLTIANGKDAAEGGGIYNGGTLTVSNNTLSGNSAGYGGGGISNVGRLTVSNSTLSANGASRGGGILNDNGATLTVSNSTLSGNTASFGGGGIFGDFGTVTVSNSTLSGNSAAYGGGIANLDALTLHNTILANSPSGGNCYNAGTLTSQGHTLDSDGTCALSGPGDQSGTSAFPLDPKLTPLQNNGGPTLTHSLLVGSPALDAGDNSGAPPTDQRGFSRVFHAVIDIGAVEQNPADLGISLAANASFVRTGTPLVYTITVQNFGPDTASGIAITDLLPAGTAFVSVTPVQGSWTFTAPLVGSTGTVQGRLQGSVRPGGTAAVNLTVQVVAAGGTTISNSVSVSAGTPDLNSANSVAVRSTNVFGRQ